MERLRLVAVVAGLAGVVVSAYLTVLHFQGVVPGCPTTGPINCDAVLSSRYAVLGGTSVPTSALGIVWFGVGAALWIAGWRRAIYAWTGAGLAFVIVLLFTEIVLLGAICLWCTAAHVLVLVQVLIAVTIWERERR
ncbi:MAG TPA: vitamin K epoxide reductase family protein [Candidatus Acidoferrum sp.]|nr:vitamin K epoxide reductase family protein [Candidatus Acidoferrum sp.]